MLLNIRSYLLVRKNISELPYAYLVSCYIVYILYFVLLVQVTVRYSADIVRFNCFLHLIKAIQSTKSTAKH